MLKTLLVLGRVSNLPTVWSNCMCAWAISGGGPIENIIWVLIGSSLLYVGGMYQNDYCDIKFDQEFRPERPIPSGAISRKLVLIITILLYSSGLGFLSYVSLQVFLIAIILLCLILLYNFTHKKSKLSPFTMAGCRAALILTAGASASGEIENSAIYAAAAIYIYISSLSFIARKEASGVKISLIPAGLIFLPFALLFFDKGLNINALTFSAIAISSLWILFSLSFSVMKKPAQIGKTITLLLAGIPLIDLTKAISLGTSPNILIFLIACFVTTLIAQKYIPAT